MVCHAEHCRLVGGSAVCDVDSIVVCELICHDRSHVARESHVAVRVIDCKLESLRIKQFSIIYLILPALSTAVEAVRTVILIQYHCLAVKLECSSCNTVRITSDRSTEVARKRHIILDIIESEDHISHLSVPVRHHNGHKASAEIGDTHLHSVCIGQCVKRSGLSALLADKILRVKTRKCECRLARACRKPQSSNRNRGHDLGYSVHTVRYFRQI